jgi:hypothetical protein
MSQKQTTKQKTVKLPSPRSAPAQNIKHDHEDENDASTPERLATARAGLRDEIQALHQRLAAIEQACHVIRRALVFAIPAGKLPKSLKAERYAEEKEPVFVEEAISPQLTKERRETLLRLFEKQSTLSRSKKLSQSYNAAIVQQVNEPVLQIVPLSILRNRCGLRRIFAPRPGEENSAKVFDEVLRGLLDDGKLVLSTVEELDLGSSAAAIVLSPVEYKRQTGTSARDAAARHRAGDDDDGDDEAGWGPDEPDDEDTGDGVESLADRVRGWGVAGD